MAYIKPTGVAIAIAITDEAIVPTSNVKIPNFATWLNGFSTVLVKKSYIDTRLKNSTVSDNSLTKIPILMSTEIDAMRNNKTGISFSIFSETCFILLLCMIIFRTSVFVTGLFVLICEYLLSVSSMKRSGETLLFLL